MYDKRLFNLTAQSRGFRIDGILCEKSKVLTENTSLVLTDKYPPQGHFKHNNNNQPREYNVKPQYKEYHKSHIKTLVATHLNVPLQKCITSYFVDI